MKRQWTKFIIVLVLYLLFLFWVKSWLGLIVVPFIFDAYITKKIKWQWWKDREGPVRFIMSWVDAIVFALVAVYFINQFFFQNYVIPSSSLEKSLLTGDYLFVSKLSYGPRIPQTPLTMPLTQHTLPVGGIKSYIEWPHWDYRRVSGLGHVELNDIVVFNYPAGDTICTELPYQTYYYELCYDLGYRAYEKAYGMPANLESLLDSISPQERLAFFSQIYASGKNAIQNNWAQFGDIDTRPTDRRENYVKRCVGLPGQTLQIKDRMVFLDGKVNKEPDLVQYGHTVTFKEGAVLTDDFMEEHGITCEDLGYPSGSQSDDIRFNRRTTIDAMPLTQTAKAALEQRTDLVESITLNTTPPEGDWHKTYPQNANLHWTRDNYGPIWIPKKGETIDLADSTKLGYDLYENYAIYERAIRAYEGNKLEIKNGQIFINDQPTTKYTFKLDYYWMMGDNRHNSADSRYWGFVPEDHIVGKPIFIWWSSDPDRGLFSGGIRWNRLFRMVDNIK
ncbi:MAG: signal peptidase I [Prevotella sp.]|nr:signal peptidase I [Prevotella sp.]